MPDDARTDGARRERTVVRIVLMLSLLLCGSAIAVFTLVLVDPVVTYAEIFSGLGAQLPLPLRLIFFVSNWYVRFFPVLALAALIVIVVVVRTLPRWSMAWSVNKETLASMLLLGVALVVTFAWVVIVVTLILSARTVGEFHLAPF